MEYIIWKGDPILYSRKGGFGLVIRDLHYWYDSDGRLERMEKLNKTVLTMLLDTMGIENREMVEVAYSDPQKETKDEPEDSSHDESGD